MKKATEVKEILQAFDLRPLSSSDKMDEFYVSTTDARGDDAAGKLRLLLENVGRDDLKFLFMGHNGCGKSTELYKVAETLNDDYFVVHFSIAEYTDILGVTFIDIIFSVIRHIATAARDNNICIDHNVVKSIYRYWKNEEVVSFTDEESMTMEAETTVGASLLELISAKVKFFLQSSTKVKREVTEKIEPLVPELIAITNSFIKDFKKKLGDRKLLIMIDDLDKLGVNEAQSVFIDHCRTITSLNANIVYTFPIFLYYSPKYKYITNEFDESLILSMIKVKTKDGSNYDLGIQTISQIIYKRAQKDLFEQGVIDYIIEKSGGSIRTAFRLIREAALLAQLNYEKSSNKSETLKISKMNARNAYIRHKSDMEKIIRKDYLPLLKEVARNKRPIIDKDNILVMDLLTSLVVIEYNGERWCDLNPAIRDFLEELGEI